ncbi:MAG: PA2779 family protein [Burkholderiales bacterium]|nr:PA2779 family protein [Burkholderiales bacterium]
MDTFDKNLIRFLIVSLCYFGLPIRPAHAELVSTYSITAARQTESARQKLEGYLEREEVRAGLEKNGVNPAAAKARVSALSDEEVAAVAGKIDSLPAGGEFIGALVFVFVLLLVTDILGLTKVYSFTRSVKK